MWPHPWGAPVWLSHRSKHLLCRSFFLYYYHFITLSNSLFIFPFPLTKKLLSVTFCVLDPNFSLISYLSSSSIRMLSYSLSWAYSHSDISALILMALKTSPRALIQWGMNETLGTYLGESKYYCLWNVCFCHWSTGHTSRVSAKPL